MSRLRLFLWLVLCVTLSASMPHAGSAADTTLIVLRHADRNSDEPNLNATGVARATNLPAALQEFQIDAIFAPDLARNLATAAPLSKATGAKVQTITAFNIATQIKHLVPKGTAVWIGNKTNLSGLWDDLELGGLPPLRYGEIFIILDLGRKSTRILRREFKP